MYDSLAAVVTSMSQPTLWTIVLTLAAIVTFLGKNTWKRLGDCEEDRSVLHKRVGKLEVKYAIISGKNIDDSDSHHEHH